MYKSLFRLAAVMVIALVGSSAALPTVDNSIETDTHALHKRDNLPDFDWDKKANHANEQKNKIKKAWAGMLKMSYQVSRFDEHEKDWPRVLDHYFVLKSTESKLVHQVFRTIANNAKKPKEVKGGGEMLKFVQLTNKPVRGWETFCDDPRKTSHSAQIGPNWVIRVCPAAYDMPVHKDTKCDKLGDETSGKMSTIDGLILYEVLKIPTIGLSIVPGLKITDEGGSGPVTAQTSRLRNGNDNLRSANNYRWFAQELFSTLRCKKTFGVPINNADYLDPKGK